MLYFCEARQTWFRRVKFADVTLTPPDSSDGGAVSDCGTPGRVFAIHSSGEGGLTSHLRCGKLHGTLERIYRYDAPGNCGCHHPSEWVGTGCERRSYVSLGRGGHHLSE